VHILTKAVPNVLRPPTVRRALLGVVGTAALLTALPAGAATTRPSQRQEQLAHRWYQQVLTDLRPLDASLVAGLQATSQWQSGNASAAATARIVATDLSDLAHAVHNLQKQRPLAGNAGALADYTAAVDLYLQAFRLEEAATQLPAGPLVAQLQRSFERVRELGDVTYDLGTTQLAPLLGSTLAGADVQAARSIPDWTSEDLAPELPLESSWTGSRTEPSGTQSFARWATAVRADRAPPQSTVGHALKRISTSTGQLSGLARSLQGAEVRLDAVATPKGDGQASGLLRLGLLVDAEAVLAEEASDLAGATPDAALRAVASSLASIGGGLRSSSTAAPK
jgi:hypothetical protein